MITKIHGIVLSVVSHNDRNNVVTLYTAERGRIAFLSPVSSGKSGRMRKARLFPLAMIEADINFRQNKNLQYLGTVATPSPWRNLYFDPKKAPIVIFLTEFLSKILRTSEPDPLTWNYIISSLATLDSLSSGLANYHLAFLVGFLHIAGIAPDISQYKADDLFDMRAAEFISHHPGHHDFINTSEAALIPLIMRINFDNLSRYKLNVNQRRRILNGLMKYYSLHLPITSDFKSLDILSELLA